MSGEVDPSGTGFRISSSRNAFNFRVLRKILSPLAPEEPPEIARLQEFTFPPVLGPRLTFAGGRVIGTPGLFKSPQPGPPGLLRNMVTGLG